MNIGNIRFKGEEGEHLNNLWNYTCCCCGADMNEDRWDVTVTASGLDWSQECICGVINEHTTEEG